MQSYESKDIRNIAIVGHGTCGKTILSEAMLATAGAIDRMGSIESGNTASDYHADEQKRQISITATPLHLEWLEKRLMSSTPPATLILSAKSSLHCLLLKWL